MSLALLRVEALSETRMIILFNQYSPKLKEQVMKIPGARWVGPGKGGPGFRIQKDMQTCNELRRKFGDKISFSDDILDWGRTEKIRELEVNEIATLESTDYDLSNLQAKLAGRKFLDKNTLEMREVWDALRPDQKVGIQYYVESSNPLIADEAGLGKTWQVIGGILQADQEQGPNLVICPKISIENVWLAELNLFQDEPVFVAPEGRRQRLKLLEEVRMCLEDDVPFWLVLNPSMVGLRKTKNVSDNTVFYDHITETYLEHQFPFLFEVQWNNVVVDEFHESGLPNPSSQFSRAMKRINAGKRCAMSGTPMGGKPERLWGVLHWLEPRDFGSKVTWLKRWTKEKKFIDSSGKERVTFDKLKGSEEERFYREHAKYIIRRRKEDVMKDLPPLTSVDVWVEMSPVQEKQYLMMEEEAIVGMMESEELTGKVNVANVLATNTWLKQFANAYCDLVEVDRVWNDFTDAWDPKYKAMPTCDCPKLEALWSIIREVGADDPTSGEQIIFFSQFRPMVDMVVDWLREVRNMKVAKITGKVNKRAERNQIMEDFQAGGVYQLIGLTTKAGGVSINLDRANTVVFLDETYNPDDQEQAVNRALRASRIHHVTSHTIRTRHTIEEDVLAKLRKKQNVNDILLDRYRQLKKQHEET